MMNYKNAIISLVNKIQNQKYLERIYQLVRYLYLRED